MNSQLTYLAVNRQYDAAGHLTSQTYGNGLVETRSYDLAGRLITQQLGSSTRSYGYDEAGNLASYNEDVFNRALGYDLLDRLTSSVPSTGPAEAISYDANGNRLSLASDGVPTAYSYTSGTNRLAQVGATPRSYDAAGNTATDGSRSYVHAASGDLSEVRSGAVTLATYAYDYRHQRTGRTTPGGTGNRIYLATQDGQRIATYDGTGALLEDLITVDGEPLALIQRNGAGTETLRYLHPDRLHTPRTATSTTGTTVWRWRGTPFGEGGIDSDPDGDGTHVTIDLRYPGQWFDDATGLVDNWHRTYEPTTGRYLQSDPIGITGGVNTYAYVLNNPLRWTDPTGLAVNPPICNGPDCIDPPYDPTPNGPKPSPQPKPPGRDPTKNGPDCTKQPTFHACMSCCSTVRGQMGTTGTVGSACAESCMRKEGITMMEPNQCLANNQ